MGWSRGAVKSRSAKGCRARQRAPLAWQAWRRRPAGAVSLAATPREGARTMQQAGFEVPTPPSPQRANPSPCDPPHCRPLTPARALARPPTRPARQRPCLACHTVRHLRMEWYPYCHSWLNVAVLHFLILLGWRNKGIVGQSVMKSNSAFYENGMVSVFA